jgi:hypothetical protein
MSFGVSFDSGVVFVGDFNGLAVSLLDGRKLSSVITRA